MAVSILHRATGVALTIGGLAVLTWWLMAIGGDANGFAKFSNAASHPIGLIVLIGLSWSFFQHLLSGIRHLVMDTGSALELNANKNFAIATVIGSILLTAAMWIYLLGGRS
jgi:succinate dehydrogenase / fumarate reductase cytochrome b subunit